MVSGHAQDSLINIHIEKLMAQKLDNQAKELERANAASSLSLLRNDDFNTNPDSSSNFKTERRAIKRKMKKMLEEKMGENQKYQKIKLNRNGDRINISRGRNQSNESKAV